MVGLTGRMIGGGLGTGRLVSTRRSCFWVFCCRVGDALRCWGMRSTTIPRMLRLADAGDDPPGDEQIGRFCRGMKRAPFESVAVGEGRP